MKEPAIGLIEFKSIAKGIAATDVLIKKAPIRILETHPICPGKYMTLFCGDVADVEEALKAGVKEAGDLLVNDLILPNVHKSVIPAITGSVKITKFGAIAIIETFSIVSAIVGADIAAKETQIELVEIRLAQGLGGKAYFVMTGELADVQASFDAAKLYASKDGMLAGAEIIKAPHQELIDKGIYW